MPVALVVALALVSSPSGWGAVPDGPHAGTAGGGGAGRSQSAASTAQHSAPVTTERALRAAWADPRRRRIDLGADIVLRDCASGDPIRESPFSLVLDGHGHAISQACFEKRLLRQDGSGYLDLRAVTLSRGGADGPGAALTSRGEVMLRDVTVMQNLAEEVGGGVFSMRRITAHRSHLSGNLANDDGGGLYARRGGVQVYDSVLSNNLVDGSGGAIGSTGDILVVRSEVDGNTTDGDGGALYADEDGDVVVIGSHIDGSAADGPGGAIFTLDGDVAVYDSTLIGNRADDRGGAIAGEGDVLVVNSTLARNLAIAHAGGAIWSRGDMTLVNATVATNYAEGEGGGLLSAGDMTLVHSTIVSNIAPVGGDLGSAGMFTSFASVVGPPITEGVTGDTIPTRRSCRVYAARSRGWNFVNDDTCRLERPSDILGEDPLLEALEDDPRGFVLMPQVGSPLRGAIPGSKCRGRTSSLPHPLPGGQLLGGWVSWKEVLAHDARGRRRDRRAGCDVGAVQSGSSSPRRPAGAWPGITAGSHERGGVARATVASVDIGPRPVAVGTEVVVVAAARRRPAGATLRARLRRLDRDLGALSAESDRFDELRSCLTQVGVDRRGDPRHRWGFHYDERDGTGPDLRPALVLSSGRHPDFRLLDLATTSHCLSAAPSSSGTGDDARATATPSPAHVPGTGPPALAPWLRSLERVARSVEDDAARFDAWQSCLAAVPVTEAGARWQRLGYLTGPDSGPARYSAALDVDTSEWDDPDYQLIGFRGGDRPRGGHGCDTDPGESLDRSGRDRRTGGDLRDGVAALEEEVEDLREPVQEITQLDECMYTVGVAEVDGLRYEDARGHVAPTRALAFAMRGHRTAPLQLLVLPGEEPPQIECNEDAGNGDDDDD